MHLRLSQVLQRALVATSLLVVIPGPLTARADDEGFLSRLFRGGSSLVEREPRLQLAAGPGRRQPARLAVCADDSARTTAG